MTLRFINIIYIVLVTSFKSAGIKETTFHGIMRNYIQLAESSHNRFGDIYMIYTRLHKSMQRDHYHCC